MRCLRSRFLDKIQIAMDMADSTCSSAAQVAALAHFWIAGVVCRAAKRARDRSSLVGGIDICRIGYFECLCTDAQPPGWFRFRLASTALEPKALGTSSGLPLGDVPQSIKDGEVPLNDRQRHLGDRLLLWVPSASQVRAIQCQQFPVACDLASHVHRVERST
jgi:hypothetical protein